MVNTSELTNQMLGAIIQNGFLDEIHTSLPNDGDGHDKITSIDFRPAFVCDLHDAVASSGWRGFNPMLATPTADLVKQFFNQSP